MHISGASNRKFWVNLPYRTLRACRRAIRFRRCFGSAIRSNLFCRSGLWLMLIGSVQFMEGIAWLRAVPPSGVVGPLLFAVSGMLVGSLGILFFAGAQAGLHTMEVLHMGGLILARTGTLPQKWQEAHQAYYCSRVGVKALAHLHGVPMGQLIKPIRDAWAGPVRLVPRQ